MPHKLVTFFLCLIIGLGLFVRVVLAAHYPLWLDERFSLLFSWNRTPLELLIQNKDVHPGLSYVFLKGLLVFTRDLFALRLLLSVLPQLIGSLCVVWWARRKQWSAVAVLFLAFVLFLDPFFVFTGIHLRMYGLVCLAASLTYIALKRFQQNKSTQRLLAVLALLLVGNAISYAVFCLKNKRTAVRSLNGAHDSDLQICRVATNVARSRLITHTLVMVTSVSHYI